MAGVFQAAGEVEAGRVLGDQGPVPGPLPLGGLVPGGVEGEGGGAEVAGRPGPLGLDEPQQVQEVAGRVRGAFGQPPGQLVQFGQQAAARARVRVRVAGLPGQGQRAQQAGDAGRVEAGEHRNELHGGRGVPLQAGLVAEDGGGVRMTEMSMKLSQRVAGVLVGGNRIIGRGRAVAK